MYGGGRGTRQPTTLADPIPGNPFMPSSYDQQQAAQQARNAAAPQSYSGYGGQSSSSRYPQSGIDPNPNRSTDHRAPGASDEDDVLARLGLCSNEDYVKQSRQEYKAAVHGLMEVQQ